MTGSAEQTGPLAGIKVIDVSSVISGPCATGLLGDQGADVIKVEPMTGDIMRARGKVAGITPTFVSCNRGKRSIALDLKNSQAVEIMRQLIAEADVFVQNFRPGVAERLGVGPDEMLALNPRLIYLSISGVGDGGPYVKQRVYDPVVQALSGLADIQADPETGRPKMIRTVMADKTTSVFAAQAVTAALYARSVSGKGQHVQVSMLDTMVSFNWLDGMAPFSVVGKEEMESKNSPHDMIYPTSDGYVTFGAISNKEWVGLCNAIGRPDLIEDPRFATPGAREINRQERLELIEQTIRDIPSEEMMASLREHDVPAAPVRRRSEVMNDPQVQHNNIVQVIPQDGLGEVRQARAAALFSDTPNPPLRHAPLLGENTTGVLDELGFDAGRIEALRAEGVVG